MDFPDGLRQYACIVMHKLGICSHLDDEIGVVPAPMLSSVSSSGDGMPNRAEDDSNEREIIRVLLRVLVKYPHDTAVKKRLCLMVCRPGKVDA